MGSGTVRVWRGTTWLARKSLVAKIALVLVGPLAFTVLPAVTPAAHAVRMVTISFSIDHVHQVENPDTAAGDGDYYPAVSIIGTQDTGPATTETRPVIEDDDFNPHWQFTKTVAIPDTVSTTSPQVFINVALWDHDTGPFEGGDDLMDINQFDQKDVMTLIYNVDADQFLAGGDVAPGGSVSQGD